MIKKDIDFFDEEDWDEKSNSLHHLGQILDEIQDNSITKKDMLDYIKMKSEISSKHDSIKELLFLREHINILSSTMIYLINKRLYEVKRIVESKKNQDKKGDVVDLENPLYSVIEVGKILGLQRQTVYNIIKTGNLRVIKQPGTGLKISSQDLNNYIKKFRTES